MSTVTTRPVAVPLVDSQAEVIGGCYAALVVGLDPDRPDTTGGCWAVTHQLGTPAGGTHTEVTFVDDTAAELPERRVDDLVRQVIDAVYGRRWAFHYRPDEVADRVLRHGSRLRERIEVSGVEVWA